MSEASTGQVILDWMEAHAGPGFVRSFPQRTSLDALREAGAPEDLVALYACGGAGVVGLLPYPATLAHIATALSHRNDSMRHEGDPWPLTDSSAEDGLFLMEDGSIESFEGETRPIAPSLESMLRAQLEALQSSWSWHPEWCHFVPDDQQPDRAVVLGSIAAYESDASVWLEALTASVCEALLAGRKAPLPGLGDFSVRTRRSFHNTGPGIVPTSSVSITAFRAGKELKNLLSGSIDDPTPIEGPSFGSAHAAAIYAALRANVAAVLEKRPVAWPGLGELSALRRTAFVGHNPRTGAPLDVPTRTIAMFRAYPALHAALNPDL